MMACPSPADAASVPCNISVHAAIASTLAIDTDPDVRPNSFGTPYAARAVMGTATGHPVSTPTTVAIATASPARPSSFRLPLAWGRHGRPPLASASDRRTQ